MTDLKNPQLPRQPVAYDPIADLHRELENLSDTIAAQETALKTFTSIRFTIWECGFLVAYLQGLPSPRQPSQQHHRLCLSPKSEHPLHLPIYWRRKKLTGKYVSQAEELKEILSSPQLEPAPEVWNRTFKEWLYSKRESMPTTDWQLLGKNALKTVMLGEATNAKFSRALGAYKAEVLRHWEPIEAKIFPAQGTLSLEEDQVLMGIEEMLDNL